MSDPFATFLAQKTLWDFERGHFFAENWRMGSRRCDSLGGQTGGPCLDIRKLSVPASSVKRFRQRKEMKRTSMPSMA